MIRHGRRASMKGLLIASLLVLSPLAAAGQATDSRIEEAVFGKMPDGAIVRQFTLRNHKGMTVRVINYGATITAISVPDRNGVAANVILGSDSLADYLGRFSAASVQGRFANRIARGHFVLDGTEYQVTKNIGEHHLHGGRVGFAKVVWEATPLPPRRHEVGVRMRYLSADGEEGYPGALTAGVTYSLTDDNELRLDYTAATDKPTVVNLTNHAYFDLSATGKTSGQLLWINADQYTVADNLIPTGEIAAVKGKPLDFTTTSSIGARASLIKPPQRQVFDDNFVINGGGSKLVKAAEARDPGSGRVMEVLTTQPGLQLYTGNPAGFCLETHHYPDSPNQPGFPSTTVRPGKPFASTTIYRFRRM
jgi:aldose 1-epimerase